MSAESEIHELNDDNNEHDDYGELEISPIPDLHQTPSSLLDDKIKKVQKC